MAKALRTLQMIARNLTRRLERLEDELIPEGEPKVLQIVFVDSDGTRELGHRVEIPSYSGAKGRWRGTNGRQSSRRGSYR